MVIKKVTIGIAESLTGILLSSANQIKPAIKAAALANAIPVALATNGTVLEARGFASNFGLFKIITI